MSKTESITAAEALHKLKNARYLRPGDAIAALQGSNGPVLEELIAIANSFENEAIGMAPIYAVEALGSMEHERAVEAIKALAICPNELLNDAATRALSAMGKNKELAEIQEAIKREEAEKLAREAAEKERELAEQNEENSLEDENLAEMAAIYRSMPIEQLVQMNQMLQDKFFFFFQVFENLKKMSSVYDQERLHELLLQSAKQFIRNKYGILFLQEEEINDRLPYAAGMGIEEETAKKLKIGGALLWHFKNDREFVNMDQLDCMEELKADIGPFAEIEAFMFMPLVNKDELIGVVVVGRKENGEDYTHEETELIRTFLDLGSVSVANASLYASQQKLIGNMFGQTLL